MSEAQCKKHGTFKSLNNENIWKRHYTKVSKKNNEALFERKILGFHYT